MTFSPSYIKFGSKIPASIATPEALAPTPTKALSVTIKAYRSTRTVNTGVVYLGNSSTDESQLYPLTPGQEITILAGGDGILDLSDIYVDSVTSSDGVQFCYTQPTRVV